MVALVEVDTKIVRHRGGRLVEVLGVDLQLLDDRLEHPHEGASAVVVFLAEDRVGRHPFEEVGPIEDTAFTS